MRKAIAIVTRGIPGSGKSTWAETFVRSYSQVHGAGSATVLSTDDHFVDSEGVYKFNINELSKAHAMCFARFCDSLRHFDVVVVANTFTQSWELEAYRWYSDAVGAKLYQREFIPDSIGEAIEWANRNVHGVTKEIIGKMLFSYEPVAAVPAFNAATQSFYLREGVK